jgi:indole-3-glycerol phosphate synthase
VIAEVKRASPSRGPLAPDLDPVATAQAYVAGGAAAVSVLTAPEGFLGSLADLAQVASLGVPTLRKDFLVDPYQVWEARAAGAAAVLLLAVVLDDATLRRCSTRPARRDSMPSSRSTTRRRCAASLRWVRPSWG